MRQRKIELDTQDALNIAPDQMWAVVTVPYVSFLKTADPASEIVSHARSADIFAITGQCRVPIPQSEDDGKRQRKSSTTDYSTWYKFDQGWLDSRYVQVYDTKLKALEASRRISPPESD